MSVNLRKKQLELVTRAGAVYPMPFVKLDPRPSVKDPIVDVYVDRELANEAATFILASGREGAVPLDHVLDYNRDPAFLATMALHQLTVDAIGRMETAGLSKREVARRLGTSVPQLYRLLDTTNHSKSFTQMFSLLQVLDCDIRIVVKPRRGALLSKPPTRQRRAA
ncbi:MAG: helix-turn-helix domain-containing protein [Candidatus Binatia bacterium]